MPSPTRVLLVGGFLGAGKTTLIARAAEILATRGQKVGLVTNDQAPGLVDTAHLAAQGCDVEEVAGGCFCCRFDDLLEALGRLAIGSDDDGCTPDVLIGEPVGSCTDLAATVVRPLQLYQAAHYSVAPFTVVVDPHRAAEALGMAEGAPTFPDNVTYIYRKQLEEADVIAVNKIDPLAADDRDALLARLRHDYPAAQVVALSAQTGEGVETWLDLVLKTQSLPAGRQQIDVDYDTYAEGEAALGWLNADYRLSAAADAESPHWPAVAAVVLDALRRGLIARNAEVAHLKIRLVDPGDTLSLVGNLTRSGETPSVRVETGPSGPATPEARLTVNARARIEPEGLEAIVAESLAKVASNLGLRLDRDSLASFAPGRPVPTHRLAASEV
jgi:G3E family GTPase